MKFEQLLRGSFIKVIRKLKAMAKTVKDYFFIESGGKHSIHMERAAVAGVGVIVVSVVCAVFFTPRDDLTFYNQASGPLGGALDGTFVNPDHDKAVQGLLSSGKSALNKEQQLAASQRRGAAAIQYFAPQLIGVPTKGPPTIRTGAKLLGFLVTAVDTREPSIVSVLLPQGGTSDSGFEIERNSILIGKFSYRGQGSKVTMNFSRLDTPDGDSLKISATALDAADYTVGVRGSVHSDDGLKVASSLGLSMGASMADVLTEREVLGNSIGPSEAKPTMKNALLQGMSDAAAAQAGRVTEEIGSTKDYVVVSKGKEIIIQLNEDLKHD